MKTTEKKKNVNKVNTISNYLTIAKQVQDAEKMGLKTVKKKTGKMKILINNKEIKTVQHLAAVLLDFKSAKRAYFERYPESDCAYEIDLRFFNEDIDEFVIVN